MPNDMAGSAPEKRLPYTRKTSILHQLPREAGTVPDRSLLHTWKDVMSTNAPMSGEIVPFRLQLSR